MNHARDITQDLQDWLHEPDRLPPPRISEVAPLVHRTPQERGRVSPLLRRFPTMLTATTSLTAAVIVALVGGFLLTGLPTQPADDRSPGGAPVESTMADSTPTSVVNDVGDHGTIISQAGTLAWERIHETTAPRFEESWSWLGDSVVVRRADDERLFVSPDGIEWSRLDLPDLPAGVRPSDLHPAHGGGVAWLLAPADTGPEGQRCLRRPASQSAACQDRPVLAWRTVGGGVWERVESGSWPRPAPAGFEWTPRLHSAVSNGDVTLALEDAQGMFPGAVWASDRECSLRLGREGDDGYLLVSEETEDDCPTRSDPIRLIVGEEEDGLVVTDRDSGEVVRIAGADHAVLDWIVDEDRYGVDAPERLVVLSDDGISYMSTPWLVDEYADTSLFAADGVFYAFAPAPSPATTTSVTVWGSREDLEAARVDSATVWRSEDGVEWSELGPADAPDFAGATDTQIHADARAVYVDGDELLAASLDGLDFNKLPAGSPELWKTTLTPLGWVAVERFYDYGPGPPRTGDAAWLYQGDEWVSLAPLGFDCGVDDDGQPSSVGWVGETIFISARGCDGTTGDMSSDIWLIRKGSP